MRTEEFEPSVTHPTVAAHVLRREKRWAAAPFAHARAVECLFYHDAPGEAYWEQVEGAVACDQMTTTA